MAAPILIQSMERSNPNTCAHMAGHMASLSGKQKEKAKQFPVPCSQSSCGKQSCPLPNNYKTMQGGMTKNIILWFFTLEILQSSETEALHVAKLMWDSFMNKGGLDGKGVNAIPEP